MKALLYTLALAPLWVMAGEAINEQVSVPSDGSIHIDNHRGNITITGWDKNELKITGELDEQAQGYSLETRGQRTDFIVNMPSSYHSNSWGDSNDDEGSKLTIFMPMKSALNFQGVSADIKVSDLSKETRIETVNGDIDAKQLVGQLHLETVNGDVDGENLQGEIHYQTVNGDITDVNSQGQLKMVLVNGDAKATTQAQDIRFENVNGDLTLNAHTLGNLKINTVNGEIEVRVKALNANAQIRGESVSGDFDLYLPKNVSARFDLQSHVGGRIGNELSDDKSSSAEHGPGESLSFTLGQGEAEVDITTLSGNTHLKRLN